MKTRTPLFMAMLSAIGVALLTAAPAWADQVVMPGGTLGLSAIDGSSAASAGEGAVAEAAFDVGAGAVKVEVDTGDGPGTAEASAMVYSDFQVAEGGGRLLEAQIRADVDWSGYHFVAAAGSTVEVSVTLRLTSMSDPAFGMVQVVHAAAIGPEGCDGCIGVDLIDEGDASVLLDAKLRRGDTYRLAMELAVSATNDAGAAGADYFDGYLEAMGGGARWSNAQVTVEPDVVELLEAIYAKVTEIDGKVDEGFGQMNARFDVVDAQLNLAQTKLDTLQMSVDTIDDKVDDLTVMVGVIDDKVDAALAALADLRRVTCDLERLVMTPEGQRASDIPVCEGSPGFPFDWPEPRLDKPGNGNGNGNGNGDPPPATRTPRPRR